MASDITMRVLHVDLSKATLSETPLAPALVLVLFVATYPVVFVVRAVLGQALSTWIGSEEILLRTELEELNSRLD
ncbi:hypothetical protein ACFLSZ_06475 [Candidatus Bipolaricaulota bacterium]